MTVTDDFRSSKFVQKCRPQDLYGSDFDSSAREFVSEWSAVRNVEADREGLVLRNFTHTETTMLPFFFEKTGLRNSTIGRYGLKAEAAFDAEERNFDTAFYRLNRRDQQHLFGWLFAGTKSGPDRLYVTWFRECFSHQVIDRGFHRNLMLVDYANRLRIWDTPVNWGMDRSGFKKTRRAFRDGRMVDVPDPLYVHFGQPKEDERLPSVVFEPPDYDSIESAGLPGEATILCKLIPRDKIMTSVDSNRLNQSNNNVFISRAKDLTNLVNDLTGAYFASRPEFDIWQDKLTIIAANLDDSDLKAMFDGVGLQYDYRQSVSLGDLVHWFKYIYDFRAVGDMERFPERDIIRVRELITYSSVLLTHNGDLHSLTDLGAGDSDLVISDCTWKNRLAAAYEIISIENGEYATLCSWGDLKSYVYYRSIIIGYYCDLAAQLYCGHPFNLLNFNPMGTLLTGWVAMLRLALQAGFTPSGANFCMGIKWNELPRLDKPRGDTSPEFYVCMRAKWFDYYGGRFRALVDTTCGEIDPGEVSRVNLDGVSLKDTCNKTLDMIYSYGVDGGTLLIDSLGHGIETVKITRFGLADGYLKSFVFCPYGLFKSNGIEMSTKWRQYRNTAALRIPDRDLGVQKLRVFDLSHF
jgi:hypothetical protein